MASLEVSLNCLVGFACVVKAIGMFSDVHYFTMVSSHKINSHEINSHQINSQ